MFYNILFSIFASVSFLVQYYNNSFKECPEFLKNFIRPKGVAHQM